MAHQHWTVTLVEVFKESGMSRKRLSEESGVGLKSVHSYIAAGENGGQGAPDNPQGDTIERLARALGTTERYLRYKDAEPPVVGLKKVPLLSMNEIGTLKRDQDVRQVWDGKSIVSAPMTVSNKAFAVEVTDIANETRVHLGDVVIFEPLEDDDEPQPGSYVVAVVQGHRGALLRRYRAIDPLDKSTFMLMAENTDFAPVKVDEAHPGFIVGRAVKRITDM